MDHFNFYAKTLDSFENDFIFTTKVSKLQFDFWREIKKTHTHTKKHQYFTQIAIHFLARKFIKLKNHQNCSVNFSHKLQLNFWREISKKKKSINKMFRYFLTEKNQFWREK